MKLALRKYGVDAFVAHEDIEPTKEWQAVIEAALQTCDALAALLHEGFHDSKWTDQEVGFALGRGRLVIGIRLGLDPYGFIGSTQGVAAFDMEAADLARRLVEILLDNKKTTRAMTDALVAQVEDASSFDQANSCTDLLAAHRTGISADHIQRLRDARENNSQVEGAWNVRGNIRTLEKHLDL